jgi:hypothetical protein
MAIALVAKLLLIHECQPGWQCQTAVPAPALAAPPAAIAAPVVAAAATSQPTLTSHIATIELD